MFYLTDIRRKWVFIVGLDRLLLLYLFLTSIDNIIVADFLHILNGLMDYYIAGGPVISVMRCDLQLNGNYKAVLRRVRKSVDSRIVVVGSTASVAELLKQVSS